MARATVIGQRPASTGARSRKHIRTWIRASEEGPSTRLRRSDCTNVDARGNVPHSKLAKSETSKPSLTTVIQRSAPCGAVAKETRVTVSAIGERDAWQPRLGRAAKRASRKLFATHRDSASWTARLPDRCGFTLVAVHTNRVLSTVEPCIQRRTMLPGRDAAAVSAGVNTCSSVDAEQVEPRLPSQTISSTNGGGAGESTRPMSTTVRLLQSQLAESPARRVTRMRTTARLRRFTWHLPRHQAPRSDAGCGVRVEGWVARGSRRALTMVRVSSSASVISRTQRRRNASPCSLRESKSFIGRLLFFASSFVRCRADGVHSGSLFRGCFQTVRNELAGSDRVSVDRRPCDHLRDMGGACTLA